MRVKGWITNRRRHKKVLKRSKVPIRQILVATPMQWKKMIGRWPMRTSTEK